MVQPSDTTRMAAGSNAAWDHAREVWQFFGTLDELRAALEAKSSDGSLHLSLVCLKSN